VTLNSKPTFKLSWLKILSCSKNGSRWAYGVTDTLSTGRRQPSPVEVGPSYVMMNSSSRWRLVPSWPKVACAANGTGWRARWKGGQNHINDPGCSLMGSYCSIHGVGPKCQEAVAYRRPKPCHDFLYMSGAFRRLYPVGRATGLLGWQTPPRPRSDTRSKRRNHFVQPIGFMVTIPYSQLFLPCRGSL
jgi:hypothetical protein